MEIENSDYNDRTTLVEVDGEIFYKKIKVAKYNSSTDTLDFIHIPCQAYYSQIAAIERRLIKIPAHQKYNSLIGSG